MGPALWVPHILGGVLCQSPKPMDIFPFIVKRAELFTCPQDLNLEPAPPYLTTAKLIKLYKWQRLSVIADVRLAQHYDLFLK